MLESERNAGLEMGLEKFEFKKQGLFVKVYNNNITKAYRKLKRLIRDEGIDQEIRKRQCYEKPSVKRKRLKDIARRRWQKKQREMNDNW